MSSADLYSNSLHLSWYELIVASGSVSSLLGTTSPAGYHCYVLGWLLCKFGLLFCSCHVTLRPRRIGAKCHRQEASHTSLQHLGSPRGIGCPSSRFRPLDSNWLARGVLTVPAPTLSFFASVYLCTKLIVVFFSSTQLLLDVILHLEGGVSAVPAPVSTSIILYEYRGLQVVRLRIMGIL